MYFIKDISDETDMYSMLDSRDVSVIADQPCRAAPGNQLPA
jgi:hypothetical protein